jgi:hypothetical protein
LLTPRRWRRESRSTYTKPPPPTRRVLGRVDRAALAQAARRPVGDRCRDRNRLNGRRSRPLRLEPGRPAGHDRPSGHQPAIDRARPSFSTLEQSKLPESANPKINALSGVEDASAIYPVDGATVRRNALVNKSDTSGIRVYASDTDLPRTLTVDIRSGRYLDRATARFPTVVLGAVAARRLGVSDVASKPQAYIGNRYYRVIGILGSATLDARIDRAALIGLPQAEAEFDADAAPRGSMRVRARAS